MDFREQTQPWPVLRRYDALHLPRVALPLGGIGTGTVSIGGRGGLRDWEIVNRPAKGFIPENCFFVLRIGNPDGTERVTRVLEGPLDLASYEGGFGSPARNHGLPRFRECAFEAAYPLGQVALSDPDLPATVRLQAFNPLIPGDVDRSSLPVAVLRYVVTNRTNEPFTVTLCGCLKNFIGDDGKTRSAKANRNQFRTGEVIQGLFCTSDGVAPDAETFGTMALGVLGAEKVTYRTAWANLSWGDSLLDFWDDLTNDGHLEDRDGGVATPAASLAKTVTVSPGQSVPVTFLLASAPCWTFPAKKKQSATAPRQYCPAVTLYEEHSPTDQAYKPSVYM